MSEKKYDLAQVSENTKLAYLQSVLDYKNGEYSPGACERAASTFFEEAEVKKQTARGILQKYLDRPLEVDRVDELVEALTAIEEALEVLP